MLFKFIFINCLHNVSFNIEKKGYTVMNKNDSN